jgi:hypothetical protein
MGHEALKDQPGRMFDPTGQWSSQSEQSWIEAEILDNATLDGLEAEGLVDAACDPEDGIKQDGGDEEVLGMDKSVDDENMQGDEEEEVEDKQQISQAQTSGDADGASKSKKKRKKKARMAINLDTCSYSVFPEVVARLGWRVVEEEANPRYVKRSFGTLVCGCTTKSHVMSHQARKGLFTNACISNMIALCANPCICSLFRHV